MLELEAIFPSGMAHFVQGGLMIGAGVALLYMATGLIGGMSSVFTTSWSFLVGTEFFRKDSHLESRHWRLIYAIGLVLGALLCVKFFGVEVPMTEVSPWQLLVGGFIAGFGARFGNGCTSGHGICGMASLSLTSFLAVVVFLSIAIITAQIMGWVMGGTQ